MTPRKGGYFTIVKAQRVMTPVEMDLFDPIYQDLRRVESGTGGVETKVVRCSMGQSIEFCVRTPGGFVCGHKHPSDSIDSSITKG
jgi:hypothetical protein